MTPRRTLAVAGREVLRVGLGGARWSITDPADDGPAERLLTQAIEAGVTYVDTARAYTTRGVEGHNERLVRRVLDRLGAGAGARDEVLVATKGGHFRDGDRYLVDASPAALRADCRRSLGLLGRERIDLYYLHFPDPRVPLTDSAGALADLRREGLVGAVGLCNVTADQLREALDVVPVAAVQNPFSAAAPPAPELVALTAAHGIALLAASPLGGVRPAGAVERLSPAAGRAARARGVPVPTVLLAWLLGLGDHVGVVTGARRPATLAASVLAADLPLTRAEHRAITDDLQEHP
ncbi:aldo/keto reductase [Nocardioides sp. WV_118_6]